MNAYAYADAVATHLDQLETRLREQMRLDRADVFAESVKGDNAERAARVRHIEDVARDLRAGFRSEVMELREEVGELVAEVHGLLSRETADRTRETDALMAVLAKHDKAKS